MLQFTVHKIRNFLDFLLIYWENYQNSI
jgi:hypothetical protein